MVRPKRQKIKSRSVSAFRLELDQAFPENARKKMCSPEDSTTRGKGKGRENRNHTARSEGRRREREEGKTRAGSFL